MARLNVDVKSIDKAAFIVDTAAEHIEPARSMVWVDAGDSVLTSALAELGRTGLTSGRRLRAGAGTFADELRAIGRIYRRADEALARVLSSTQSR